MTFVGLTLLGLLAQTPTADASAADRAAAAAERAATAAEKAANAAARIADAVAPAPAAAAPAAAPAPAADAWKGSAGIGLAFITGNTQMLTLTANVAADKKWEDWALGIRLSGAYGLSNPDANVNSSTSSVTARRASGTVRGDRTFNGSFASVFVLGGIEMDHVKNIESRSFGEAGTGLTFFNEKKANYEKLFLRVDLAMRGGYETRYQFFPAPSAVDPYAVVILAPRAAAQFRWAFSKEVRFSEELEFIPFLLAPTSGRLLINNTTKLAARVTESVALTTALVINYDSMPPPAMPARLSTDVALTVGLEAGF
jgi:putative salt-induced outer membrane protein YdiY